MRFRIPRWLGGGRFRSRDPFTRPAGGDLDILSSPRYDSPDEKEHDRIRRALEAEVDERLSDLLPGAVDAYTGDALHAWIDARERQLVARLDAEREERQAVSEALIGLAKEELARRRGSFEAARSRLDHAREARDVTRRALTGKDQLGPFEPGMSTLDPHDVRSTLGPIHLTADGIEESRRHIDLDAFNEYRTDITDAARRANGHNPPAGHPDTADDGITNQDDGPSDQ